MRAHSLAPSFEGRRVAPSLRLQRLRSSLWGWLGISLPQMQLYLCQHWRFVSLISS
jgi:hypothetical protein